MTYTNRHSKTETSPRMLDALDAMKDALRQHDMTQCQGCFDVLTTAFDRIADNPEDEKWYLEEWSRMLRMKRVQNGPSTCQCKIPAWPGLSASLISN